MAQTIGKVNSANTVINVDSSTFEFSEIEYVNVPLRLKKSLAKMIAISIKARQGTASQLEVQKLFMTELESIKAENKHKNALEPTQINDIGYIGFMTGWEEEEYRIPNEFDYEVDDEW